MSSPEPERGATAVISHRVRDGQLEAYDHWLNEIGPACRAYPGHLDLQIIQPVKGITATYTVIIRFDTHAHLLAWMQSQERKQLIDKVRPLLTEDDKYHVQSGLEFWFMPEDAKVGVPRRWKQFLVTWSAIYPLVLAVALATNALSRQLAVPDSYYLKTLLVTGGVVLLMVYVVMPRYTMLVHRWLYR